MQIGEVKVLLYAPTSTGATGLVHWVGINPEAETLEKPGRRVGLRSFLSRLLLWRCSIIWYAFLFLGIPLIFYCGAA